MDRLEFKYGTHCSTESAFYSVLLSGRFHSSPILVNYKTFVAHKEISYMSLPAIDKTFQTHKFTNRSSKSITGDVLNTLDHIRPFVSAVAYMNTIVIAVDDHNISLQTKRIAACFALYPNPPLIREPKRIQKKSFTYTFIAYKLFI